MPPTLFLLFFGRNTHTLGYAMGMVSQTLGLGYEYRMDWHSMLE